MTTKPTNLLSKKKLAQISSGKIWSFHGGIHPQENKQQTNNIAIEDAGVPPYLVIGIEYKGHIPELLVSVGDFVLKGQPLTKVYGAMVVRHATSSGVISAIEKRTDLHPSGLPILSIVIETDGLDNSISYKQFDDYKVQSNATLIETIQNAGIIGLGGAGFPTHLKLLRNENMNLLLINSLECEPYITADDLLMQEKSNEIIAGIKVLQHILKPDLSVIAVEDNKPQAIKALNKALQENKQTDIIVRSVPTCYPSGSAKQLIEIITGQQVPRDKHLTELGMVMLNVGTVFAIKEAIIDGKPLLSRIVTMTGDALQKKGNARVRIGTPLQYLLNKYQQISAPLQKIIIGGPLMGFTVPHTDVPVTKICNCIIVPSQQEMPEPPAEMPCIRCGACAEVCPVELLPQQLLWHAKSKDTKKLTEYNLSACMECGACAYVCPSHIPLVQYYRVAKAEIKNEQYQVKKTHAARIRFENRQARLEQAKLDRQAKHKQAAASRQQQLKEQNGGEDLIAAALARAKAKKVETNEITAIKPGATKNTAVAAAIARAKTKKAEINKITAIKPGSTANSAVAAAITRAKAKKAQANENTQTKPGSTKNAAVAAAIARAKAKKAALAESPKEKIEQKIQPNNDAAIAERQERKKQARLHKQQATEVVGDSKKNQINAAVAKAKAKKLASKDQ